MGKLSVCFLGKVFSKQGTNVIIMSDGVYGFSIEKIISGKAIVSIERDDGERKTFSQDLSSSTVFSETEVLHLLSLSPNAWLKELKGRNLRRHQVFSMNLFLRNLLSSYQECLQSLRI